MSSRRTPEVLRPALLASAAIMIALGLGLWLIVGETVAGIAIAAIGVVDLLTMNFVLGRVGRASAGSGAAPSADPPATPPAEPDPSYNPYARED